MLCALRAKGNFPTYKDFAMWHQHCYNYRRIGLYERKVSFLCRRSFGCCETKPELIPCFCDQEALLGRQT